MRQAGLVLAVALAALAPSGNASAQGACDGTWKGNIVDYTLTLKVTGEKGKLHVFCGPQGLDWDFDIAVAADCSVAAWIASSAPRFQRSQLTGRLPSLMLPTSQDCRGGTGTLSK